MQKSPLSQVEFLEVRSNDLEISRNSISYSLNIVESKEDSIGIDNYIERTGASTENKKNTEKFSKKNKIIKGLLQKKRKSTGKHTKKSLDNERRKIFSKFFIILVDFFNGKYCVQDTSNQIKKIRFSNNNFFNNDNLKKLLDTELKDILNRDIRKNYKKYIQEYNSELIKEYLKSSNEEIISFFNCKLIDCIKYFRKDEDIRNNDNFSFLKGLEEYYVELENYKDGVKDEEDKNYLYDLINLTKIIEHKLSVHKKPKKKNKEMDN